MNPPYDDIRSRIVEEPSWYDIHGVPRYGKPHQSLLPFMRCIRCQRCLREFRVCLIGEIYHGLYGETYRVELGDPCPANPEERHARVVIRTMTEINRDFETIAKPLPNDWHYGDPPSHEDEDGVLCIGVTMNSIPEYDWVDEGK